MNKLILKIGGNGFELKAFSAEEIEKKEQEYLNAQNEKETLKPYFKLKQLDNELPRWAEDMAIFTGVTLQGRAEEVRLLKVTQRAIIQAREDNAA